MVIGKGGLKIKEIGNLNAQGTVEEFLGARKVYLGLKVDVIKDWTKDAKATATRYLLPGEPKGPVVSKRRTPQTAHVPVVFDRQTSEDRRRRPPQRGQGARCLTAWSATKRALVHDLPGVTRDRLEVDATWWVRAKAFPVIVTDTGGLGGEKFADEIKKQVGIALAAGRTWC